MAFNMPMPAGRSMIRGVSLLGNAVVRSRKEQYNGQCDGLMVCNVGRLELADKRSALD